MRRVSLRRGEEAVASSIGTMLAVLVVLALIMMISTSWAPEWTEGKEAEHLRTVESQMSNLKALIDSLTLSGNTNAVVSSPITLGSSGVPLFSGEATGTISLLSSASDSFNTFRVTNSTGTFERVAYGSIVYESHNTEFVDQTMYYECGAIIINQGKGYVVSIGPSFILQNVSGEIEISLSLVSIYSDGNSYTSTGTVGIQCRLVNEKISTETTWPGRETVTIQITSPAYKAWFDYYNRVIPRNGLGSDDYDISVNATAEEVSVELRNVVRLTADYVILGATLDLN
jgi:hypothetical protein